MRVSLARFRGLASEWASTPRRLGGTNPLPMHPALPRMLKHRVGPRSVEKFPRQGQPGETRSLPYDIGWKGLLNSTRNRSSRKAYFNGTSERLSKAAGH